MVNYTKAPYWMLEAIIPPSVAENVTDALRTNATGIHSIVTSDGKGVGKGPKTEMY